MSREMVPPDLAEQAVDTIRFLAVDAVERASSGHPGMPMGMADAAFTLFSSFLRHDPTDPAWPDRDRFVLSAGHGSTLLYGLLHLTGLVRGWRQFGAGRRLRPRGGNERARGSGQVHPQQHVREPLHGLPGGRIAHPLQLVGGAFRRTGWGVLCRHGASLHR